MATGCRMLPGELASGSALWSSSVMVRQIGGPGTVLDEERIRDFAAAALAAEDLDGKSVCLVVPDGTRNCPLPLLLSAVHQALYGRASRMTVLIALGTHAPMTESDLAVHAPALPGMTVINHEWWEP